MAQTKQAIHNSARSLNDNEIYILQVFDLAPSGLLVRAYQQAKSLELYLPISESEIDKAELSRSEASLCKLSESLELSEKGGRIFLESRLPGILKQKVVPSGDGARQFIGRTKAGDETLPEFLTKGLAELCKAKPAGLEATRWLGNWLLENNPNKPKVQEAPFIMGETTATTTTGDDKEEEKEMLPAEEVQPKETFFPEEAPSAAGEKEKKFEVVFVLGGPGAGKGTQCLKIAETFGYVHLSAGDLLRAEREDPASTHGELINNHIKNGDIVPVTITLALLKKAMEAHAENDNKFSFLIDGFPRNLENFQGWTQHMSDCATVQFLLYLETTEATMEARILQRQEEALKSGTAVRADDNIDSMKKRFTTYVDSTVPIINHFKALGTCRTIDSSPSPTQVFEEISKLFVAQQES